ncbi:thioesterase family protein [Salinispira pacifica]|uniref:Mesenchymal stem cell protein DSCD75 n=1 Tax=Salinispira pacifica TaxID=1307761 RepID=V5WN86_9SPIO|nr:thioesterase family protein [Salinispira pacifica]AHC16674.1 Mesenchymal stem cell protein DSCD75 [Salinispira pacifica]
MNLYFRLIRIWLKFSFAKKQGIYTPCVTRFRAYLRDIDFNLHVNNARYLSFMDLSRLDFLGKVGLLKLVFKHRLNPIVAAIDIKFIKEIKPFEAIEIVTQLDHFDHKYFYLTQTFQGKHDRPFAVAKVRGIFVTAKGKVPPEEVIRLSGHEIRKDLYVDKDDSSAIENWRTISK